MIATGERIQLFIAARVRRFNSFGTTMNVANSKRRIQCSQLLLSLLFGLMQANGQKSDINFINFTSRDGLSSSSVNAIIKDRYGYMWFATDDGLDKFDGINFTVYRNNPADTSSIGGNIITALYEDHEGNLWIGNNRTLSLYDRKKDAFRNYNFLGNSAVRAICADHLGNLWVGGYSGLYKFNLQKGTIKNYNVNSTKTNHLTSNTVLSIFEDSYKRLWIGTNAGLNLYEERTNSFVNFLHSDNNAASLADNVIRSITEDSNGSVWFGTNNGLSKLQQDGKTFVNYTNSTTDFASLGWNRVYAIKADKLGQLWVGTEEGVNIFNIASEKSLKLYPDKRNKYSLKGKSVRSIFIDDSGIYWVGVFHGGLHKYDKNLAFFNLWESNPFDPYGLSSSIVTSFVEDPSGDIYIGTDGGGLNLYHRKTGLFSHPKLSPGDNKLSILAMELLGDELWIGTYHQGVYVLNIRNSRVKHFIKGSSSTDLSHDDIFCLKKDSKGNMWIGTNGEGVNVYNSKTGEFDRLAKNAGAAETGFTKKWFVRAIEEDKFGNLWIGSNGAGIGIYNPSQKTFKLLNTQNSGLPSNIVLSLLLDRNGRMWAGTLGGGLSLFDNKSGKFISYAEQEGVSNAVIHKILEDDSGNFWVSTNKGLSSFNPQTGRFKNYSYQNGLQRSTFSSGSGLKTSKSEMFFGGLDGFNYFDPLALHSNKNVPSLQLTALKISNRTVNAGEDEAIKEHISIAKEIFLDYKQNFSLDFIALNYTAPEETRYSYKLDGFDADWNAVGQSHTAVYTNLDPGQYTFRIKAMSDDGSWSTPEKTIQIYVKPPFWRTTYAYAFYVLFAFSLVALWRYQGMRKVKNKFALEQERLQARQLIEQERKEAERQREFDQLRIKFLTNLSHEFRTPISLIAGPVDKLIYQEESDEKKQQLSMVKRNAERLLNLVNQLLDFKKLEQNELNLNLTGGDIISFIKEIADSFRDVSEVKQVKFSFSSSISEYYTSFDCDKIERVLLNLLSNAFKFTPKHGQIELLVEKAADSSLKIIVSDTGVGMPPEVKEKIFDRFFQAHQNNDVLNQGNGIGLSIAKEFVRLHGGTINVESTQGKGSRFTVMLPCELLSKTPDQFQVFNGTNKSNTKNLPVAYKNGTSLNFTVLLIEDNDDFRQYLRENLKPYYRIVEASDGKEGWQKVLSSHPHVVVSDINMPYMDGITLSRKIKSDKRTSHIPIILLTAITGDANQLNGLQTGAIDYLTKPFNFEILNAKIKNLVALNQNLKETYSKQWQVVPSEVEVQSEDAKLLAKIAQYIESNIDSPELNVEELSKHVFMSRGTLYSKIIETTGETPVEFIRSIRLKKAAALLEKSDMKVSQIGYAVGFSSPNYFARAFKAKYNLSPSEYVEQKRGLANSDNSSDQS
jgi:signal transduction histidine kinase/ligand-binding sensor domain-containing protein/CheY-like chemotaxis protein/AraC-like DNA-binding protein